MPDIPELEAYVEAHPADHEQRWRLAKKLYKACEYERALKHIKTVKQGWYRKLNVLRYLGAAYYRLGRREEAIEELDRAARLWPKEVSVREQLARMLESADQREKAAKVWDEIAELDPNHPVAEKAAKRLRDAPGDSPMEELHLAESDSGIDLLLGWICPKCGAQNNEEFERCWQCHAPASKGVTSTPKPVRGPSRKNDPWIWTLVTGFSLVAVVCAGLYLFVMNLASLHAEEALRPLDYTVPAFLSRTFFAVRGILALALLVAWPLALKLALQAFLPPVERSQRLRRDAMMPTTNIVLAGLFLALLVYLLTWVPMGLLLYAAVAPALVSLVLVLGMFRVVGVPRGLAIWLTQGAAVLAVTAVCVVATLGLAPMREFEAITRYAEAQAAEGATGHYAFDALQLPATIRGRWGNTGSSWLDGRAGGVTFEVAYTPGSTPVVFELKRDDETVRYVDANPVPFRMTEEIAPGSVYDVVLTDGDAAGVSLTVYSVLPVQFSQ